MHNHSFGGGGVTEVLLTAQKLLNNPTEEPQLQPSSLLYCSEAATGLLVSPGGARPKVTARVKFGGFSSQVKQRVCVCVWLICFRVQLEGCSTRGIPLLTPPPATSLPDVEKTCAKTLESEYFKGGEYQKFKSCYAAAGRSVTICSRTLNEQVEFNVLNLCFYKYCICNLRKSASTARREILQQQQQQQQQLIPLCNSSLTRIFLTLSLFFSGTPWKNPHCAKHSALIEMNEQPGVFLCRGGLLLLLRVH